LPGAHMVRTFHVPTVSICAHGLSFLSVADLSTQPRLLSWYAWVRTGEGLAPRRFSSQNFYVPGVKLRSE